MPLVMALTSHGNLRLTVKQARQEKKNSYNKFMWFGKITYVRRKETRLSFGFTTISLGFMITAYANI